MFDEMAELEELDRQRTAESFVEVGRKAGIDVVAEILGNGKSVPEVFALIAKHSSC